jgi:hypothetical protein
MKRIVTGLDAEGRSCVVSTDELPDSATFRLWSYEPGDLDHAIGAVPEGVAAARVEPPVGGLRWVLAVFAPGSEGRRPPEQGFDEHGFHVTRTIDLLYLVSGEVSLLLDQESVRLGPGDLVVQQATRHSWRNESDDTPATAIVAVYRP